MPVQAPHRVDQVGALRPEISIRRALELRLVAQPVDARQRPEVHQHDAAAQPGGAERLGVEPLGRPPSEGMCRRSNSIA
jgi:hypothetical protein